MFLAIDSSNSSWLAAQLCLSSVDIKVRIVLVVVFLAVFFFFLISKNRVLLYVFFSFFRSLAFSHDHFPESQYLLE